MFAIRFTHLCCAILLPGLSFLSSQALSQGKKTLSPEVHDSWNTIRQEAISADGQWAIYTISPLEGDAYLQIKDLRQRELKTKTFARSQEGILSADNRFVVFKIKPALDSVKALRRLKTKKEKMPKDTLAIYALLGDSLVRVPRVMSFRVPEKAGAWLAYQLEPGTEVPKPSQPDSLNADTAQSLPKEPITPPAPLEKKKEKPEKEKPTENPPAPPTLTEIELAQQKIAELEKKLAEIEAEKARQAAKAKEKPKAPKKEDEKNGSKLILRNLSTARQDTFLFVTDYRFDEQGTKLAFVSTGNDSTFKAGVYVYDLGAGRLQQVLNLPGKHQSLHWDKTGTQLAFVSDTDTTKANEKALIRYWDLYYWADKQKEATLLAKKGNAGMPKDWLVNPHAALQFSKDGTKLYFGTNPPPLVADTTLLPEEIVKVDIWNWQDSRLQSQQIAELENDQKRAYLAVAYPRLRRLVQLGTPEVPQVLTGQEGNAEFAIGLSALPYQKELSWEGYPARQDVYLINYRDGRRQLLKEKLRADVRLSPGGQYLYWYAVQDTAWCVYSFKTAQTLYLTKGQKVKFYNEFHDYPNYPDDYGTAGWTENDAYLLIYDRYDIWKFQPEKREAPARLTQNGRENRIRYRYIPLDPEVPYIKTNEPLMLYAFDEETKASGYFSLNFSGNTPPAKLLFGDYAYDPRPEKARNANRFLFTRESFTEFPDLYFSEGTFTKITRLSQANPQQGDYYWGSVELVKWTNMNGEDLQGLLYKPEKFDPGKKYPMITYFYERLSDNLHRHIAPTPSPSTVRASEYTSNGYLVFMPDIPYRVGYPGRSAYEAVVSGITSLLKEGFVDRDKLGLQGQSWGGYQVAYIITQTDMFAAAMAGAPVSNMTSAYGGIRWESGMSRMFQYEHTQSRLGKTLWEDPWLYMENSPLFRADRITTPLLMMHNDADGAVPWYQGIELFVALRRLNKPVWMLTYNGEAHNLRQTPNRKDLSVRMQQFFDYYLKFAPAPRWMQAGVPALEKGIKRGYELTNP